MKNAKCSCSLATKYLRSINSNDNLKGIQILKVLVQRSDKYAAYILGYYYECGCFVRKNIKCAIGYYNKAAILGYNAAAVALADIYIDRSDAEKAIYWLKISASHGDSWAHYMLGLFYQQGTFVRKNIKQARLWYERAVLLNYDSAQLNLGIILQNNLRATEQDKRRAILLFRKAARQGNVKALYFLGISLANGCGVRTNNRKALYYLSRAAKQGHAKSACLIGYRYFYGIGIKINQSRAVYWYRIAAKGGDVIALYNLGLCYLNGDGVVKSKRWAKFWLIRAAKMGHGTAKKLIKECN